MTTANPTDGADRPPTRGAVDGRRRRARRRLGADGLARRQRPHQRRRRHARARARRDAQLGYRPNSAARALRTGRVPQHRRRSCSRSRPTATCAPSTRSPTPRRIAGYSITLHPGAAPHRRARSRAPSTACSEQAVDGVIIIIEAHLLDERRRRAAARPARRRRRLRRARDRYPSSTPTRRTARGSATEHLLGLGPPTRCGTSPGPERSYSAERRARVVGGDARARRRRGAARARRRLDDRVRLPSRPRARRASPRSPRSSPRTTRWRSACCARCTSRAARCRTT